MSSLKLSLAQQAEDWFANAPESLSPPIHLDTEVEQFVADTHIEDRYDGYEADVRAAMKRAIASLSPDAEIVGR